MAYELCKYQIQGGNYNKKEMEENLILFKMTNQLTSQQYLELYNMINPVVVAQPKVEESNVVVTPAETAPIQPQA
ncbi:hypothetical protein ACSXBM_14940 (plasmid) [Clostridium perfringens]|nr:hypothetical protein [Clostridium perfringens]